MTSFESLYIPHDIFNGEIEDNVKGSNLLKVTQQVAAGVKDWTSESCIESSAFL